jgi:hypothetical protein
MSSEDFLRRSIVPESVDVEKDGAESEYVARLKHVAYLSRDIIELREQLAELEGRLRDFEPILRDRFVDSKAGDADPVRQIEVMIRARALRLSFLPDVEFGEAAWDMLLDLTVARFRSRQTSISSLCIAAGVPTTTALRALKKLIADNVLERFADPQDGRRSFVRISDGAYRNVLALAAALIREKRSSQP